MPERDKYPGKYFSDNPFEGHTPHQAFKRLQWGNEPTSQWSIEAPEPMATLGRVAKIIFVAGWQHHFRDYQFYLAVGVESNWVYFVPMDSQHRPLDFPVKGKWRAIGKVRQTEYYSEKGGQDGHYYHSHEKPYPTLLGCNSHYVIKPAKHSGGRSYAVSDEGIIG